MGAIIVGVDGSRSAAAALRWAVQEGGHRGWPVDAILAWTYLDQYRADGRLGFSGSYREEDARAALDAMVTAALGADAAEVRRRVLCDHAAVALLRASCTADLLVVGARGRGGFRGLRLGSVSEQVLGRAECPVAVIPRHRNGVEAPGDRIVVGVDGSPASVAALSWAVDAARVHHATLDAVLAWGPPAPVRARLEDAVVRELEGAAAAALDVAVDEADAGGLSSAVHRIVTGESPVVALLGAAKGATTLVVGARGCGGFDGLLVGSVSHQLAHHAPCPVVVVRAATGRRRDAP